MIHVGRQHSMGREKHPDLHLCTYRLPLGTINSLRQPAQAGRNSQNAPAHLPPFELLPPLHSQVGQGEKVRHTPACLPTSEYFIPSGKQCGQGESQIGPMHPQATIGDTFFSQPAWRIKNTSVCLSPLEESRCDHRQKEETSPSLCTHGHQKAFV